jgi:hypothetical protein
MLVVVAKVFTSSTTFKHEIDSGALAPVFVSGARDYGSKEELLRVVWYRGWF